METLCTSWGELRVVTCGALTRTVPSRCTHFQDGRVAGVRGDWRCCCRGIPQSAPEGLFLLGKILLNPAAPSIQGRVCPLTQPTSPARPGIVQVRAHHGPTLNCPQPAHMVSMGLPLHPYSPPCDFKQPDLSWCCSSLVWQGREPLTWLSPWSPVAGRAGAGLGLQSPWSLSWFQGPFCPEAIPLPSVVFSVLYTFWSPIFINAGVLLAV